MQQYPVCFGCGEVVDDSISLVFEAPCGHEECPSGSWHGLCLMEWREKGRDDMRRFGRFVQELIQVARSSGIIVEVPDEDDE